MTVKATSANGSKFELITGAGTAVTGLSFTAAKPAHLSGTGLTFKEGDVVVITGSGVPKLDNTWIVGPNPTATDITLLKSDTTGAVAGTLPAGAVVTHYAAADVTDFTCLIGGIQINTEQEGTVNAGTFCNPSYTVAIAAASAGTVTFSGVLDSGDAAFAALEAAAEGGQKAIVKVILDKQGYILLEGTIGSINIEFEMNNVYRFSFTLTLSTKQRYLH